ncbi:MAG: inorganic phosphate transporter [Candidatus Nanoarchaeia archaeon]|nr:inorganic phosphate transporter [Candidatus Nanoarchaeia archaeon]
MIGVLLGAVAFYVSAGMGAVVETFSSAISSKSIKIKNAVIISAVVIFIAVIFYGQVVSKTFRSMVPEYNTIPVFSLAVMISIGLWFTLCAWKGWPISTTSSVVGAVIGAAFVKKIPVNIDVVWNVLISWIASPLAGMVVAFFVYIILKKLIINRINNFKSREVLERVFSVILIIISILVLFEKSVNDVANAIAFVPSDDDMIIPKLIGAAGMSLGMLLFGKKILKNLGIKLTAVSPSASFSALFSAYIVLKTANFFGMPISSTMVLVSGMVGSGLSMKRKVNKKLLKEIMFSWVITLPVCAILSGIISFF